MSTVMKVNFEPQSDVLAIMRRSIILADKTLASPDNAVALVDGEWCTLNSSYKLVRATTIGSVGNPAAVKSFPVFDEKGRTDNQAMAEPRKTILFRGEWEFDTRIYGTAVVGSGANLVTAGVMKPLKVATITIGSRNFSGLVGHGGSSDTDPIVGYTTKLPADNGGKLRFISGWRV